MKQIKVLIASAERLFRESLVNAFANEKGIQVVGETDSGLLAIEYALHLAPDILILETYIPDLNGIEVTQNILSLNPNIKIIALSRDVFPHYIRQMLDLGVTGYLLQSCTLKELLKAIHLVAKGEIYLCPEVAGILVKRLAAGKSQDAVFSNLSGREIEVLQLIAEGYKPKEIAEKLFISPKTVQIHQANLKKKLHLTNTAELTKYAVSKGITPLDFIARQTPPAK